jgi:hypothetical protein
MLDLTPARGRDTGMWSEHLEIIGEDWYCSIVYHVTLQLLNVAAELIP